jgi:hypothetical protein
MVLISLKNQVEATNHFLFEGEKDFIFSPTVNCFPSTFPYSFPILQLTEYSAQLPSDLIAANS